VSNYKSRASINFYSNIKHMYLTLRYKVNVLMRYYTTFAVPPQRITVLKSRHSDPIRPYLAIS